MPLTTTQLKEILEGSPTPNRRQIPRAIKQENRLRLHSETVTDVEIFNAALTDYLRFVEKLLPPDKFRMFKNLLRFPLSTVQFTDSIYTALSKIFDGRNPVFDYEFTDDAYAEDWDDYRTEALRQPRFWQTEGFEKMKTGINSVMVVDLPETQDGDLPEPYLYFLDLDKVIDFEFSDDGDSFDWIIFKLDKNRLAVLDDETYRIFDTKGGARKIKTKPDLEAPHGLGVCPSRFFWSTSVSDRFKSVRKSPLSNFLGGLDMLLFLETGNDHLNLYGRWPVTWVFGSDCDYQLPDNGGYCQDGYLKKSNGDYLEEAPGVPKVCPICDERRLNGPGTLIEVDPPTLDNEGTNLREPIGHVTIDRESLDYNSEDLVARKAAIYASVTGFQGSPVNDKAVNEKQVLAMFESLETALEKTQTNFERAWAWSDDIICRLRYPEGSFVRASISLGTEHFLLSSTELFALYKQAKDDGFSVSALDTLEDRYYETEFRNNPERLLRQRIVINLDPFRHKSTADVKELFEAKLVSPQEFVLKANFSTFLTRFERENTPITEFGKALSFDVKVQRIREALVQYASELIPEQGGDGLETKSNFDAYGVAVRAGAITPQQEDEAHFRQMIAAPPLSSSALEAWKKDKGVRRPITLAMAEGGRPAPGGFGGSPSSGSEEPTE